MGGNGVSAAIGPCKARLRADTHHNMGRLCAAPLFILRWKRGGLRTALSRTAMGGMGSPPPLALCRLNDVR
eukprot:12404327-Karenia_brevis.AAC.1